MMKLMLMVLVISDTGSVSQSMLATEFPAATCRQLANIANQPAPEQVVNGHRIVTKVTARCVPFGSPEISQVDVGPPLAMIEGFINSFGRGRY